MNVEIEMDVYFTYDRDVEKMDFEDLREAHLRFISM